MFGQLMFTRLLHEPGEKKQRNAEFQLNVEMLDMCFFVGTLQNKSRFSSFWIFIKILP